MGFVRRLLSSRSAIALLLIIAMGAFLRFFAIGSKTVWLDEAFSIWVANHGIIDGAAWLIKIDQHPPLYYALLSIWQWLFGDAQGIVRAFSALCSTLAIPFIYLATKRITQDTHGRAAGRAVPGAVALPDTLRPGSAHVRAAHDGGGHRPLLRGALSGRLRHAPSDLARLHFPAPLVPDG